MNWINHSKAELLDHLREDECLGLVWHLDADTSLPFDVDRIAEVANPHRNFLESKLETNSPKIQLTY